MEKYNNLIVFDCHGITYIGKITEDTLFLENYLVRKTNDLVSQSMGFKGPGLYLSNYAFEVKEIYEQAEKSGRLIPIQLKLNPSNGIIHFIDNILK